MKIPKLYLDWNIIVGHGEQRSPCRKLSRFLRKKEKAGSFYICEHTAAHAYELSGVPEPFPGQKNLTKKRYSSFVRFFRVLDGKGSVARPQHKGYSEYMKDVNSLDRSQFGVSQLTMDSKTIIRMADDAVKFTNQTGIAPVLPGTPLAADLEEFQTLRIRASDLTERALEAIKEGEANIFLERFHVWVDFALEPAGGRTTFDAVRKLRGDDPQVLVGFWMQMFEFSGVLLDDLRTEVRNVNRDVYGRNSLCDRLHVSFASTCDAFVTDDTRLGERARLAYLLAGRPTKVFSASDLKGLGQLWRS